MKKDNFVDRFVKEDLSFNSERDIQEVSQCDVIDLHEVFLSGSLPENVQPADVQYDGCEEPEAIIGKPKNAFDAVHMQETLKGLSKSEGGEDKK